MGINGLIHPLEISVQTGYFDVMAKVAVVIGSDSDLEVEYELRVASAHKI